MMQSPFSGDPRAKFSARSAHTKQTSASTSKIEQASAVSVQNKTGREDRTHVRQMQARDQGEEPRRGFPTSSTQDPRGTSGGHFRLRLANYGGYETACWAEQRLFWVGRQQERASAAFSGSWNNCFQAPNIHLGGGDHSKLFGYIVNVNAFGFKTSPKMYSYFFFILLQQTF